MLGVEQDDPKITDMDPVRRLWYQNNWIQDSNDQAELAKNTAYLIASFINPEAVKKIVGADTHISTEEEFEETSKMVRDFSLTIRRGRRRRRTLKE